MLEIIMNIADGIWRILLESSPFMLLGFAMAGIIKALVADDWVVQHLGKGNVASVLKASLLGMPIPLCSCGVVPAAAGLREQGASKGATAAFLISTPETGVDSVAVTYALTDPLMTLIRPLAAFFTATIAGLGINLFDKDRPVANTGTDAREIPGSSGAG